MRRGEAGPGATEWVRHGVLSEAHSRKGKGIFVDELALQSVLEAMLKAKASVLFVDALDECESGLDLVLDFIRKTASDFGTKWLISSRPNDSIDESFRDLDQKRLIRRLDLTPEFLSRYVNLYIDHRISYLSERKAYCAKIQAKITEQLRLKSAGLFLWVSYVCNELKDDKERRDPLKLVEEIPSGLQSIYKRILTKIQGLKRWRDCGAVLATAVIARRPLHLRELASIADCDQDKPTMCETVKDLVILCQHFFTLQKDRVYFIHQSAKDYLQGEGKDAIFPEGVSKRHQVVFSQSMKCLKALKKDIYSLKYPGIDIKNIRPPDEDPLLSLSYSSESWVDHLTSFPVPDGQSSKDELSDDGAVFGFLKKHFLHWLESLCLLHKLSDGILSIRRLLHVVEVCQYHIW